MANTAANQDILEKPRAIVSFEEWIWVSTVSLVSLLAAKDE